MKYGERFSYFFFLKRVDISHNSQATTTLDLATLAVATIKQAL